MTLDTIGGNSHRRKLGQHVINIKCELTVFYRFQVIQVVYRNRHQETCLCSVESLAARIEYRNENLVIMPWLKILRMCNAVTDHKR